MVPVVYVRSGDGHAALAVPTDPSERLGLSADTEVSTSQEGPFAPLAIAVEDDPRIREAFSTTHAVPMLERYRGIRLYLLLGLVPVLMLAELDRELARAGIEGAGVRLATDLFLAAVVGIDLVRRVPRHPRTSALVLLGVAMRYVLLLAKTCGHGVHLVIFVAPIVAIAAALSLLAAAPSPTRVTREVRAGLGITPADVIRLRAHAHPTPLHLATALAVAAGLPIVLLLARAFGIGVWWQAGLFAVYAGVFPWAIARAFEPGARAPWPQFSRVAGAVVLAFALTLGITNGAHYGFDAGAYVQRCTDPGGFEGGTAKRILDAQNLEVTKNVRQAREQWAYFAMTVLVVPIAEERVYRGLLQRLLVRRLGTNRGLALAALVFGLAHLGVYRVAVYQTVLLGASFGVAYGAGGIAASALTHALWNLHLLL